NWNFHRLNTTIQAILIISVTEYYYKGEDILKAIVIDNAVTLAKIYGDGGEKDYKFVNGILDNCLDNGKQNLLLD
ncbi:MAG: transcription antitermination factor NusB, partial [Candidatus Onthovivens sp.]